MLNLRRILYGKNTLIGMFNALYSSAVNNSRYPAIEKNLTLYGDEASPPVRFVMMTASVLDIELKFHKIDLFLSENKTDFFTKINPLQKVPVLEVDGKIICDSHAISLFLCGLKKNQVLYPTDPLTRARVHEMLFFNSGSLFPLDSIIFTEYFAGKHSIEATNISKWNVMLDFLEHRLTQSKWLAGDKMLLCDLCCAATISSLQLLIPGSHRHQKLNDWMKNLRELPCFEFNERGLKRLNDFVNKMKA